MDSQLSSATVRALRSSLGLVADVRAHRDKMLLEAKDELERCEKLVRAATEEFDALCADMEALGITDQVAPSFRPDETGFRGRWIVDGDVKGEDPPPPPA